MSEIHIIPVPFGMSPEDAWAEIDAWGELLEHRWWNWRFWPGFLKWAIIRND